ncbi:MAG TPA: hypothetical protein VHD36_05745 [Pirellulales bacterium]|nr:hypothetical protein [Pirellulales bacterium]
MNTDTVRFTGSTVRIRATGFPAASADPKPVPSIANAQAPVVEKNAVLQTSRAGHVILRHTSATIEVREVTTRRDRDTFVKFPWRIYERDPNWAPPLLLDVKAFLDPRKHPFYGHGAATQFVAYQAGQPVGRVLASDDPNYNQQHGTNLGCFGMFESIDDPSVAQALLIAAGEWLRRRGRAEIFGPIDYSTNYPCGLLIDGFDTPQRVMMNHNPPYYGALLEACGLVKAKDLFAWWFDDSNDMLHKWAKRAERFAARGGVTVRPISRKNFDAEVARCQGSYNDSWEKSWGFVKMTDAEFKHLALELKKYAVAELVLLAEVDGEPAGLCITLPDFNEATRPINGRLTTFGLPIGLARLLYNVRHIKTARMAVLGVVEKFRRRGVVEMFILQTLAAGIARGYTGAELSWTLEDNDLINRTIEKVGGRRYKTYRLYEAAIA